MRILIGVIVCLVAILLVVVFSDVKCVFELLGMSEKGESQTVTGCVATFLGLGGENSKSEVLKFLGIAIAGLLLMLQAVIGDRRVKAMQRTAEAQVGAAKQQAVANKHTEDGQRQERLKNAIEHLGNESDSVRMGATYELFHLAQDTQNLRQTVLDILCAHIRTKTGECRCRDSNRPRPSVEIESLLNLLFLDNHEVFAGRRIDLKESCLKGASLPEARLSEASLTGVHLQGANLWGAWLQGADIWEAKLQGASLQGALLHGAELQGALLQGADLKEAQMQGANFREARLHGADLEEAWLQSAILEEAQLQGAKLRKARLQGVRPPLKGTAAEGTPRGLFVERIRSGVGVENDLDGATFEGGLTEDDLKNLRKDLPNQMAEELVRRLQPHIGRPPSQQLPAGNGAVTYPYTRQEAEQWIDDYQDIPRPQPELPARDDELQTGDT